MLDLVRIRGFLLLTLRDVEAATGVSAAKLARAERGQLQLNDAEQRALRSYYAARWDSCWEKHDCLEKTDT